jgi:hypothetical protein
MVGEAGSGTTFEPEAVPVVDGVAGTPVPLPAGDSAEYIDCFTPSSCTALGTAGQARALLWLDAGKVTKTVPVPGAQVWNGLACSSPAHCIGVGTAGGHGLIVTWDGKLARHEVASSTAMNSVSCSGPSACTVVGFQSGQTIAADRGVYVRVAGRVLSSVHTAGGVANFTFVTCGWTATTCEASGEGVASGGSLFPVQTTISATAATTSKAPTGQGQLTTGAGPAVCPSVGKCLHFGVMDPNEHGEHGFATVVSAGHYGTAQAIKGTADVYWLSCPVPGSCAGVAGRLDGPDGDFSVATFTLSYAA